MITIKKTIGQATRPIFIPNYSTPGVIENNVIFDWHMGMNIEVRRRSMHSLHHKAKEQGFIKILEVSSKSEHPLGIQLSAFFLKNDDGYTVENLFQSSKVFSNGAQFTDLKSVTPKQAKQDVRLKQNGPMKCFCFNNKEFPLGPKSLFYDWLYIKTLFKSHKNIELKKNFLESNFEAFTDIEFNPKKSFSCQARTLALCMSLYRNNLIDEFLSNPEFCAIKYNLYGVVKAYTEPTQTSLF